MATSSGQYIVCGSYEGHIVGYQVETGAAAERYRAMHLERNGAGQRQFIVGDNIGIITVLVDKARICNQADKVRIWDASAPVVQSPSECDVDSPKSA